MKKFYENYKKIFLWIFVIGIIAHGFMLTNKVVNHDDLTCLFTKGESFSLGRWGLELTSYLFPNISMPWFHGIISLLLISLSACFMVDLLEIKEDSMKILVGGLIISFPSLTGTFAYMFTSSSYALSFLLSVLSVRCFFKGKWSCLLGVLFLFFSLSIYQAYVEVALMLITLVLMRKRKEYEGKDYIKRIVSTYSLVLISMVLYFIVTKAVNHVFHISFSEYQGANEVGTISLSGFIQGIKNCYREFRYLLTSRYYSLSSTYLLKGLYWIIILFSTGIVLKNIWEEKEWVKRICYLLLFLSFPVIFNVLYLINPNAILHTLTQYASIGWILLPIVLSERFKPFWKLFLVLFIFEYAILSNQFYFQMHLAYENTFAFYTELAARIENTEGFQKGTKILFVGTFDGSLLTNTEDHFKEVEHFAGHQTSYELIMGYSKENFIKYYLGKDYEYSDAKEEISSSLEFQEMNIYPYSNSIRIIDGVLVVKFSE